MRSCCVLHSEFSVSNGVLFLMRRLELDAFAFFDYVKKGGRN